MKFQSFTQALTTTLILLGGTMLMQQPSYSQSAKITFFCDISPTGLPTTYAKSSRFQGGKHIPVIRWNSDYFVGSGYTPMQRCQEVSGRFQRHSNQMKFVTAGYVNGQPVVCANYGNGCNRGNVLFTLKRGEDASAKLQQLFNIASAGSNAPLFESSSDDTVSVDINKYLSKTPSEDSRVSTPNLPAVPSIDSKGSL
jgi:hypothetical protein